MVDEGLSVSLDWNLQSLKYTTPSRTLSINFDPHGEIEDFNGDNADALENNFFGQNIHQCLQTDL